VANPAPAPAIEAPALETRPAPKYYPLTMLLAMVFPAEFNPELKRVPIPLPNSVSVPNILLET